MSADIPTTPFGWSRAAQAGLTFRRITGADLPFLSRLYASTRTEELAVTGWPQQQQQQFLQQQVAAQHDHYQRYFQDAEFLVIECGGVPIGRLYLGREAREHRIVDIALLPEHRRKGLGEALLRDQLDEAAATGKAVSIHVEKFNPAMGLYRRLGFVAVGEEAAYDLMRWQGA